MWFSYDTENGVAFHETAGKAQAEADKNLELSRDYADDGWDENVEDICWGEVKGKVVETERREATPEDHISCDEIVDYELQGDQCTY